MPKVAVEGTATHTKMGHSLTDVDRCPHCNIAKPHMTSVWRSDGPTIAEDGRKNLHWAAYMCSYCAGVLLARAKFDANIKFFEVVATYPDTPQAHQDIPEPARTFLQQAMDTLHAPDAAAVMAGSAVDAMLKANGLENGSLYKRIDEALEQNLLTQGMADWAHAVRLGSNRPRHADAEAPHVTPEEAKQSVEFATALGSFLFVLTAQIARGIEEAMPANDGSAT